MSLYFDLTFFMYLLFHFLSCLTFLGFFSLAYFAGFSTLYGVIFLTLNFLYTSGSIWKNFFGEICFAISRSAKSR